MGNDDKPVKSKTCGCKGCRSCLLCENHGIKLKDLVDLQCGKNFYYLPDVKKCLCKIRHVTERNNVGDYAGFNFPGVTIVKDFISEDEETELVKFIDSSSWKDSQSGRRKQDYGPKVNFKRQKVKLSTFIGLPPYIRRISSRMESVNGLRDFSTVEQCNLEYEPERGSQIDPHFDDDWLWGERLVTLNLLSDTWFTMTNPNNTYCALEFLSSAELSESCMDLVQKLSDMHVMEEYNVKNLSTNSIAVKIPLMRRSLVILSGAARYEWKHAIQRQDITSRRLCCTFRELSKTFLPGGSQFEIGEKLLNIASTYKGEVVL